MIVTYVKALYFSEKVEKFICFGTTIRDQILFKKKIKE